MGLDQTIYDKTPNLLNPFLDGEEIAYWRKDWQLQNYINTGNCEELPLTLEFCEQIIINLNVIYGLEDSSSYKQRTKEAFLKAIDLIEQGRPLYYEGNW